MRQGVTATRYDDATHVSIGKARGLIGREIRRTDGVGGTVSDVHADVILVVGIQVGGGLVSIELQPDVVVHIPFDIEAERIVLQIRSAGSGNQIGRCRTILEIRDGPIGILLYVVDFGAVEPGAV